MRKSKNFSINKNFGKLQYKTNKSKIKFKNLIPTYQKINDEKKRARSNYNNSNNN